MDLYKDGVTTHLTEPLTAEAVRRSAGKPVIGREQVIEASAILHKYKEGKANLEQRVIENERWYKLRHWECMRREQLGLSGGQAEKEPPVSAWLFNSIANKHADAMDNYPSPNILPREEGDKTEAEILSSIIPVILDQNEFEETYSSAWDDKLKGGTGIYGIFWDGHKHGGVGDVSIRAIDILNLFFEPGISDIQKSANLFHTELVSNDVIEGMYPDARGHLGVESISVAKYIYDDSVDTAGKSVVVDWYYKKSNSQGKPVLHYCKYVNDVVLFASENDESMRERGWYDHGEYPFVFDVLFKAKGTPCGFSYIDVGKSAQSYIDRGNAAIMKNMLVNAAPRYFVSDAGNINEDEFADMSKDLVHVSGAVTNDSIIPIQGITLSGIYLDILNGKVDELKETTGNRDISTGGTTSGVTAASAIAAMQEAGSKLSRDANKASYRAFRKICVMVIELIRQFYTLPRCFRIVGERGQAKFIEYSNRGIAPQAQGGMFGSGGGYRVPQFDIEVTAQKASPYSKMAQNELALQFYGAGFFNPEAADAALACLDMMDFDRKDFIMQKISENGGMLRQMMAMQGQMLQLAEMVDSMRGTNLAEQIAAGINGSAPPAPVDGRMAATETEALGGGTEEAANTKAARERTASATAPR